MILDRKSTINSPMDKTMIEIITTTVVFLTASRVGQVVFSINSLLLSLKNLINFFIKKTDPGRIRTLNQRSWSPLLYQFELLGQNNNKIQINSPTPATLKQNGPKPTSRFELLTPSLPWKCSTN